MNAKGKKSWKFLQKFWTGKFLVRTRTLQQRAKEIGIRKILGATVSGIVGLLSKDFLKLVGIAFIIATPIAYYLMENCELKNTNF